MPDKAPPWKKSDGHARRALAVPAKPVRGTAEVVDWRA